MSNLIILFTCTIILQNLHLPHRWTNNWSSKIPYSNGFSNNFFTEQKTSPKWLVPHKPLRLLETFFQHLGHLCSYLDAVALQAKHSECIISNKDKVILTPETFNCKMLVQSLQSPPWLELSQSYICKQY